MNPTVAQLRETIDFLQDNISHWATKTSAAEFAKLILNRYPDLKGSWEQSGIESSDISDWRDEPATDKQMAYLLDLDATFSDDISKAEASELIDRYRNRATDAQKRRLTFYQLLFDADITKDEASRIIDTYRTQHPESEDAYQEWKITSGIM